MRYLECGFLVPVMVLVACGAARAQAQPQSQQSSYGLAKPATPDQIKSRDTNITNDGQGLPKGHGTAKEGAVLYASRCASCHGQKGEGGPGRDDGPALFNADVGLWPYAPSIWDYVSREMPPPGPQTKSLKPDEVYAVTALLLYKNNIIKESDLMDEKSLAKIRMPNRDGYAVMGPDGKPTWPSYGELRNERNVAPGSKPLPKDNSAPVNVVQ